MACIVFLLLVFRKKLSAFVPEQNGGKQ
jgi:hypothetical protein